MKILKATLLLALGAMLVTSCGKYEDGPGLSLKTKKGRLSGTWKEVEYVEADGTTTASTDPATVEYTKDGTLILKTNDPNFDLTLNGTWEFINDKEDLEVTFNFGGSNDISVVSITRLTNKELWTKDSDGDVTKMEKQ